MSWYSGSHDTMTSSSASSAVACSIASRFAQRTRSGSITPFGSLVEPLVYCRIASRSGSSPTASNSSGPGRPRPGIRAGSSTDRRIARRPVRRTARGRGRSAATRRRRCGCGRGSDRRTPRASPSASAAAARPRRARQPARLDGGDERAAGRPEDRHVVDRGRSRAPACRPRRPGPRRGAATTARRRRSSFVMNVAPCPWSAARSIRAIRGMGATDIRLADARTGYESRAGQRGWAGNLGLHARPSRRPCAPLHGRARAGDRDPLAGPVGRRRHVRGTEPDGPARRPASKRWRAKPKLFVLDMFPYPSGAGLHVGHPLGYIGTDVYARFKRMTGYNVLHTMGYDAFGLPAEQYAVQTGQHPRITTEANIANYRRQLRRLGLGPRPAPQRSSTTDVDVLPLDAVDLPADLQLLVRRRRGPRPPDRRADRRASSRAVRETPDGRDCGRARRSSVARSSTRTASRTSTRRR